jgi:hypothetical protein
MDTMLSWQDTNLPAGTMPWKAIVGVWASRFLRLSWLDNGEAGAEGQPPPGAFPKAFARLTRLLRGLEAFARRLKAFCAGIPMLARIVPAKS